MKFCNISEMHHRIRDKLRTIVETRETILKLAEANFPNSAMETHARAMLLAAQRDIEDMENRIAEIEKLAASGPSTGIR